MAPMSCGHSTRPQSFSSSSRNESLSDKSDAAGIYIAHHIYIHIERSKTEKEERAFKN
jgi:hypothetical protein